MKSEFKYFQAPDRETAEQAAERYFGQIGLFIEVAQEGQETVDWLLLAARDRPRYVDGSFALYFEPGGVFLEVYPARGGRDEVRREDVSEYIKRKGLTGLQDEEVAYLLSVGRGRVRIAPAQEEKLLGEEVAVTVAPDAMRATFRILAPDPGGAPVSSGDVTAAAGAAGVVYGIDETAVYEALRSREYDKEYVLAKGTLPRNGENGKIIYHFNTSERTSRPVEDEKGRVNYRELDLFEAVEEGRLLVTRELATEGEPGFTVKGRELKAKPGREVSLPKSRNTVINEAKTELRAACSGMVELAGGSVLVSNVYNIKGDVNLGVGNIIFDGSVVISGNVESGFIVKATGGISIGGVVEGSAIIAGGNVEVKRGIQGMDKGKIVAGGSVVTQFIERASVSAGEDIVADAIMHSTVEAGRNLILNGKRGSIFGGSARVAREVTAKVVGSVSHAQTEIEVGLPPQKRNRIKKLQEELEKVREEIDKIQKLETYLARSDAMEPAKREAVLASIVGNKEQNNKLFTEYSEELNRLMEEMEHANDGKVHVTDTVYPGARISIGSGSYRVNQEMRFSTFKLRDGEVAFAACET